MPNAWQWKMAIAIGNIQNAKAKEKHTPKTKGAR
jgi:hypothetical protein